MLWFALHLNRLPLEAWLVSVAASSEREDGGRAPGALTAATTTTTAISARPCCVVEAKRVVQADARALALGVEPGMSAATAASLVSAERLSAADPAAPTDGSSPAGLQVFARDPAREAAQIQRLALALARFTPGIVLQPDGVLLEVSASLRLFGGARALWHDVSAAAHACGVRSLRRAGAPTATAASVLARVETASPALRRLPVAQRLDALPLDAAAATWQIEPRLVELLHGIGCRTLGDVRVLPRAGLQRRGAAALLDALARAHGDKPDPQAWYEPPRSFEMGLELLHRADDAAMLVFAVQRLVQPLAGWLAQQWLAAARVTLVLRHETSLRHAQPDTLVTLSLGDPTRDAAQLLLLLRERLQRTALPAPVYALVLKLDQAVNHAGRDKVLWRERGAAAHSEDARALFDRLAARLGAERVWRPRLVADHRPERAMQCVPVREVGGSPSTPSTSRTVPAGHAGRPTWLLPEPTRLHEGPGGRPLFEGAALTLISRVERIEAGWFDGALVSRDYQIAQTPDQRRLWLFRERRGDQAHWYLHGVFG
jgi:protein ImuB